MEHDQEPFLETTSHANSVIHELFEQQARLSPESLALHFGADQFTYAELDTAASQLAGTLRGLAHLRDITNSFPVRI